MTLSTSPDLITLAEFAARLGLTPGRVRQVAAKIPGAVNLGGRLWMVPEDAEMPPKRKVGRKKKAEAG